MEKFFELEKITEREYEELRFRFSMPQVTLPFVGRGGKSSVLRYEGNEPKRTTNHNRLLIYFRLTNQIVYNSFDSLLELHLQDPDIKVRDLWFPHGELRLGVANQETRELRHGSEEGRRYLDFLRRQSAQEDEISIGVRHINIKSTKRYTDIFNYFHESGVWILRRILINNPNFGNYQFSISGINVYSTPLYVIPAIHDKQLQTPYSNSTLPSK